MFTNVNAGRPGSAGDAFTFNRSELCARVTNGEWGNAPTKIIYGQQIALYLASDTAFALSRLMECYDGASLIQQKSFNYCVIRTRQVVEQAFGRFKGRWHVVGDMFLRDTKFATNIALVCCAPHNVCERTACPFEDSWIPQVAQVPRHNHAPQGSVAPAAPVLLFRNTLAQYASWIV